MPVPYSDPLLGNPNTVGGERFRLARNWCDGEHDDPDDEIKLMGS